jgi:hypothetical protein
MNIAYTVPQAYRELLSKAAEHFRGTATNYHWLVHYEQVKTRELIERPKSCIELNQIDPDTEDEF